jgi:hypothetical protein
MRGCVSRRWPLLRRLAVTRERRVPGCMRPGSDETNVRCRTKALRNYWQAMLSQVIGLPQPRLHQTCVTFDRMGINSHRAPPIHLCSRAAMQSSLLPAHCPHTKHSNTQMRALAGSAACDGLCEPGTRLFAVMPSPRRARGVTSASHTAPLNCTVRTG